MKNTWIVTVLVACAFSTACVSTKTRRVEIVPTAQVMLVSSFHLANNNRDLINLPIEDVLASRRQVEIEQLVDNLARWRPTKVILEWPKSDQKGLDRRYQTYLDGELELSAKEQDQIGFRLAEALGHTKVYAADWNDSFPGEWTEYDFLAWAQENGEGDRVSAFVKDGQERLDRQAERMRQQSIVDWYFDLNQPKVREQDHRVYFELATFGNNDHNPGASWVGGWYGRNLRIFNNIRDVVGPDDRVLILYGAGHSYLLDRFFRESALAEVVDPRPYIR